MTGRGATILVVDDDPVTRMLISRMVEAEGHRVIDAADGSVALDLLAAEDIDVALLDIEMPGLDGFDVLAAIRADTRLAGIPVIMISALDDFDSVVRAIELGADDHLPKPPNRTLLRARLNAGLQRKRVLDLERGRVRDLFTRFVPEPIVDQVLADAGADLRLGGVEREATVMFSDLRGFTTWAEHHSPELVIETLNHYLSSMSDAILDHGGTLVSYMGDGIMAVFGAPVEDSGHADRAVAAAQEMATSSLGSFNAWMRDRDLGTGFRMGIGLNSGPVMSGNVGSERRLEYAAVGDTTNTAARLEQMTKGSGHSVLVSGATRDALTGGDWELSEFGDVTPRGRQAALRVWALSLDGDR